MSQASRIEWTEATWNPTVGCTKISPGCKNCYAEAMAKRLQAMGTPGYENGFKLTIIPDRLAEPLARKKPTVYFVNSMSDLFHKGVDDNYIAEVFDVIRRCPQHTFQVLTKRADRIGQFLPDTRRANERLDRRFRRGSQIWRASNRRPAQGQRPYSLSVCRTVARKCR